MGKKILFQIGLTNSFSSYLPGTRDCQSPTSLAVLECPSIEARLQAHILFPCCREWSSQFGPRSDTDRFSRCFQRDAQDQMLQRQTIWEPWHLGPLIGIFELLWLMMPLLQVQDQWKGILIFWTLLFLSWIPFLYHETHFCGAWRHGPPELDFLSVPLPSSLSVEWWRARALENRVLIMRLNAKSDLSRWKFYTLPRQGHIPN